MTSSKFLRPVSYAPCRFGSGTFAVTKDYRLKQMLYNHSSSNGIRVDSDKNSSDRHGLSPQEIIPSLPFSDVPVYADTVDIETLAFHNIWGCLLTPDNIAARIATDDLRYHVWVAAMRVVESRLVKLNDKEALIQAVMNQFMIELGLVLLDLFPGPLVLFVDPRLHDDSEQMVARALEMVAKFDEAQVRRWRIMVTLPATEQGIRAARDLTSQHGIRTNFSLVSCLAQAIACIEAGAGMVSMSVEPIMEWFEKQQGVARGAYLTRDHPGIEAIQSCATFINHHGLNTALLTSDVRDWTELKLLDGLGSVALKQAQLDLIPQRQMVTWYPRPGDTSPATLLALEAAYPDPTPSHPHPHPNNISNKRGFLATLPAKTRSLVSAVSCVRLSKMAAHMETIEKVAWREIKRRIRLEKLPLDELYRQPTYAYSNEPPPLPRSSRSLRRRESVSSMSAVFSEERGRSKSRSRSRSRSRRDERASKDQMVEGVDYF